MFIYDLTVSRKVMTEKQQVKIKVSTMKCPSRQGDRFAPWFKHNMYYVVFKFLSTPTSLLAL